VALAPDIKVRYKEEMLGTDLSYVRTQLARLTRDEIREAAEANDIHPKTIRRIVSRFTLYPRSDTVGKLALYFRTKEKRRKAA
jgi:hypothetical protein